ncbi:MAG TPA: DUF3566 domain-containing protein [Actinomycetota bacterium]|nr:DUF3566 domain-containing protein [Actinomycetota bacterium]
MTEDTLTRDSQSEAANSSAPRQARLHLARLDPWSVMKTTFVLSLGIAIVIIVAVVLVWGILAALGVFTSINEAIRSVAGAGSSVFDVEAFFGLSRVVIASLVLATINIILMTALATLFAFMYNLTVPFTKGVEVTLSEE